MKVFSHFKKHVSKFKSKLFVAVKSQNALKKFFSLSIKVLILVILTNGGFYLGLNFSVKTPQLSSEKNSSSPDEIKQINIKASVDNDQVDTNPTSSTQDVPSSVENYDVSPLESPQKSEWISVGWEIQDGGNVRSIDNFKAKFANYEDSNVKAPIRLSDSKSKNVTTNPESAYESLETGNHIRG
jgi:cytoskeletal protein RodZ